ncbi:hypothetical protein E2C01_091249 [Portunus trituberculatus]|uniref:Uncharacterized protein n=1 Tax=Portunus trituberculatus TaxID=210409 RepID=A0A5B7JN27_PORTR|nr:hypothetical protein [Portunus trituberculatus]
MKTLEEKHLGVIIQENLNSEKHISKIFRLAYKMLTNIKFQFMDKDEKNYYEHDTSKAGICSCGVIVPEL